ncbi:MAG: enoyl-CoA hydratase/isomerase family protein [Pyrinomonadaceae bacterium]
MNEKAQDEADSHAIIVEIEPACAVIRLNRPQERNKLSVARLKELDRVVSSLILREDVRAIIFTGVEGVFASGADINELRALTSQTAKEFALRGQRLFQKIADATQLTVAAVNGYCMGGGLDLALACQLRCASREAVFAHPGARLGIITGWGGTQRLPALIGITRALEIFTTARRVTSVEAMEIGLVNRIGDPVVECARALARTVLAH